MKAFSRAGRLFLLETHQECPERQNFTAISASAESRPFHPGPPVARFLLGTVGSPGRLTSHAMGNHRVALATASELLAAADQGERDTIDEGFYLEVFGARGARRGKRGR